MKKIIDDNEMLIQEEGNNEINNFPGYPLYPVSEDIYSKYLQEKNIDPEDISKIKVSNKNEKVEIINENDFYKYISSSDLDVPGSELDDVQENIGSEDEENNYYSLGGDDHNDLDEDKVDIL